MGHIHEQRHLGYVEKDFYRSERSAWGHPHTVDEEELRGSPTMVVSHHACFNGWPFHLGL